MQFKLTFLLAVAVLVANVTAKCDCSNGDVSCEQRCSQKAQECFQKCQFDKSSDSECQQDCAKEYLPEGRGLQQMGGAYGNNFPQGAYQGQSYSQGGYGQPYGGQGHWQNGQWISAANGKSVEVVIPVLAAVALGMMAL
ncbi:unnamed protein product [Umbelopsis vinacea]